MFHNSAIGPLLILSMLTLASLTVPSPVPASAHYFQLPPISIEHNLEFTLANGVVGGTGIEDDPFVITAWEIRPGTVGGIVVTNTDAHVVIRDVRIHSGGGSRPGIVLSHVANARVENAILSDNGIGIKLDSVSNTVIESSEISGNNIAGVQVTGGSNAVIRRNTIFANEGNGITLSLPGDVSIVNNSVGGNGRHGVFIVGSGNPTDRITIERNSINLNGENGVEFTQLGNLSLAENVFLENVEHGVRGVFSDRIEVRNNEFGSNGVDGFFASLSNNLTFMENIARSNAANGVSLSFVKNATIAFNNIMFNEGIGVSLFKSNGILVHHNNFIDNRQQAYDDGFRNAWDNGPGEGGNFWSDYKFSDVCQGPGQTVCTGSDGIGDVPRVIAPGFNFDRRPLQAPYREPPPGSQPALPFLVPVLMLTALSFSFLILLFRRRIDGGRS